MRISPGSKAPPVLISESALVDKPEKGPLLAPWLFLAPLLLISYSILINTQKKSPLLAQFESWSKEKGPVLAARQAPSVAIY